LYEMLLGPFVSGRLHGVCLRCGVPSDEDPECGGDFRVIWAKLIQYFYDGTQSADTAEDARVLTSWIEQHHQQSELVAFIVEVSAMLESHVPTKSVLLFLEKKPLGHTTTNRIIQALNYPHQQLDSYEFAELVEALHKVPEGDPRSIVNGLRGEKIPLLEISRFLRVPFRSLLSWLLDKTQTKKHHGLKETNIVQAFRDARNNKQPEDDEGEESGDEKEEDVNATAALLEALQVEETTASQLKGVYVMTDTRFRPNEQQRYKVGRSVDILHRLHTFQTANPDITLVAAFACHNPRAAEYEAHRLLSDVCERWRPRFPIAGANKSRQPREWFTGILEDILVAVQTAVDSHGGKE